ncbi:FkbM family methyltransferase [Litoreibacter albidus]|uniref:FkbM family methyltransferase n=1 Tax=Litoreibacter albidus TaxID=670155 RepID=UPI003736F1C8
MNTPSDLDLAQSTQNGRQLFARLWRGYLRRHWPLFLLAFVFMVIEGSTLGALSYMLQPMFDLVFVEGQSSAIWWVGIGIFALFAIRGVTGIIHKSILTGVSFRASTEVQVDLLRHTLTLDNAFHSRTSPGSMIERVQGDVSAIQTLWNMILVSAGRDLIALLSLLGVALSIDWKWTLVAIIGAPMLVIPSLLVQRYVRRKSNYLRDVAGKRTTRLDEVFHGITPIKLNRMEDYQADNFEGLSDTWVKATVKTTIGQATVPALVDFAVGFGFFCVLLYGGPQIIAGEKTIGQFMSFFTAMSLAFQPMRRLGGVLGYWEMMIASLSRIFGLFDTKPAVVEQADTDVPLDGSSISFNGVALSYGHKAVLNGLSFDAKSGTTTALVGSSGAGKSTVFNVLTRLVDPADGKILIGGVDIKDMPLSQLRGLFSVVSQDALLFDETLRENILLGRDDVDEARLKQVLDDAHVSDFLKNLPDGLETQVGPRGSNLSGGQRQRVAIARALLRDTPILLLDEATSALDAESEKVVQKALERLSKGRTTLVIAHRLSTVRDADQILVLDHGTLAESGPHDDLIGAGGIYARLHDLQFQTGTKPFTGNIPTAAKGNVRSTGSGIWRSLNGKERNLDDADDQLPFGHFAPNAVQRAMIKVGKSSPLKRGVFRGTWTSMVLAAGRGKLDIHFRDCAYRIRGENNLIEYGLLLNPAYNAEDLDFLIKDAPATANFVDLGCNIGLYAQPMARSAPKGRTFAVDANPLMVDRLTWNANASGLDNLTVLHCAVSDQEGRGDLQIRKDDLAIVAVEETPDGEMPVRCLDTLLQEHAITEIYGLKVDIEGHEDKALVPFLEAAPETLLPRRIVIEHPYPDADYPGCTAAFAARGYVLVGRTRNNSMYKLASA